MFRPTLAATLLASWACLRKGLKPYWGLGLLPAIALVCRVGRSIAGPKTRPAGRCSREAYAAKVRAAEAAAKLPGPLRMYKATTSNTFRPQQIGARVQSQSRLDLSSFVHVLEVNQEELWCDLEACTTFETFTDECLREGLVPLVVPELRTITVGGAIVGIGVESSSFKHGFFHEGLLEADMLLATGEVVTLRPDGPYADLFKAVPNSLGSFGYLTRLRMRVQPAKPFVELEKLWCSSPKDLVAGLKQHCARPELDYVDAVALGEQGGMLLLGKFAAAIPSGQRVQTYGFWPQFYPSILREGVEFLRTDEYIWRWDADWFWCTQIFPGLRSRIVRWLCGPHLLRSDVYKAFNDMMIKNILEPLGANRNEELVIQDIEIPIDKSEEYIREFLRVCPSYRIGKIKLRRQGLPTTVPIWLCPVRGTGSPLMPMREGELYINFGFWDALEGAETKGGMAAGRINRELEVLTASLNGKKTLYSAAYFSEETFYREYNGDLYKKLKQKYDPNGRVRGWYERLTKS